jgi:hypothetical protein
MRRLLSLVLVAAALGTALIAGPAVDAVGEAGPTLEVDRRSGLTGASLGVTGEGCYLPDGVTAADGLLFQLVAPDGSQAAAATIEVARDATWDGTFVVPSGLPAGTYHVQGRCIAPMFEDLAVVTAGTFEVTGEGPPVAEAAATAIRSAADIEPYPSYDGQSTCSPTGKPGMVAYRDMVMAAYPGTTSYGISRDCNIGGTSEHKEGRAWDWANNANDPAARARVQDLLQWLFATDSYGHRHAMARRLGVMYIIWNRQIFRMYRPDEGWSPYSGSNPHTDHVHVSLTRAGGAGTTSFWTLGLPGPGQTGPGGFSDVRQGAWFADALEWAAGEEIVDGFKDGTFRPDGTVNRAQVVSWLWAAAGSPPAATRQSCTDVGTNAWFADALSWAVEQGIVNGYPDGTFRPDRPTNRAQLASMMWHPAGEPAPRNVAPHTDIPPGSWAADAVAWLTERAYANGFPDGTFRPTAELTRAQGVTWLYAARQFADVKRGSWLQADVDWARYRGVVRGYDDHTYRPAQASSRIDAAHVLWEAMDAPAPATSHTFSDVEAGEPAVSWAAGSGVVNGFNDGTFRPDRALNRAQAVMMLWKVAGQPEGGDPPSFTDVGPNAWYVDGLAWAVANGIVTGFADGTFRATDPVTRGQLTVQVSKLAHSETAWAPAASPPSTVVFSG